MATVEPPVEVEPAGYWRESPAVAEECVGLFEGRRPGRLLDAGGGVGVLAGHVARRYGVDDVTVLDRDPDVLRLVPAPMRARLGRVEELSPSDGLFTTVLMRQVLQYLEHPVPTLRRVRRCLAVDGAVYVGQMIAPDPVAARWLGTAAAWLSPSRHRVWTTDRLLATFGRAGLWPERATLVSHWQTLTAPALRHGSPPGTYLRGTMPVHSHDGTVRCRLLWMHALFVPTGAGRPAAP